MKLKKYELQGSPKMIAASILTFALVIYGVIVGISNTMNIVNLGLMYLLVAVILTLVLIEKDANHTMKLMKTSAAVILTGITLVYAVFIIPTFITALNHGMYKISTPLAEMTYNNEHTPDESTLPEDYNNKLIIYYRYDCPDCHATYEDLKKETAGYDVYWISSRSEQGKKLMESFPPSEVPTGLIVTTSGSGKSEQLMRPLATTKNDETVLDKNNLNALLNFEPDKK